MGGGWKSYRGGRVSGGLCSPVMERALGTQKPESGSMAKHEPVLSEYGGRFFFLLEPHYEMRGFWSAAPDNLPTTQRSIVELVRNALDAWYRQMRSLVCNPGIHLCSIVYFFCDMLFLGKFFWCLYWGWSMLACISVISIRLSLEEKIFQAQGFLR